MANVKTYNRTKKLVQSGSMLDAFVAEQMYAKIETIVEEEHLDKKKLLIETARDLARELGLFYAQLSEAADKKIAGLTQDTEASIRKESEAMVEAIAGALSQHTASAEALTESVRSKVNSVLATIETKRGPQGVQGTPGLKGKDGSPDTGEQIAKKLNKTKGTVSMAVIAGLLEEIQALKREVRKKGDKGGAASGGMGNVQHETKNLTALSTTVVTNFPISGGGYAIMGAYYQSALIMRGEHYTVGGDRKTITLLFTPEDNTKIDIIYVR